MVKFTKKSCIQIFERKTMPTADEILSEVKDRLHYQTLAKIFLISKFDKIKATKFLTDNKIRKYDTARKAINRFLDKLNEFGIDLSKYDGSNDPIIATIVDEMEDNPNIPHSIKEDVVKSVNKLKGVLDLFNVNSRDTIESLSKLKQTQDIDNQTIIKDLKELYVILIAQAKGQIVTKRTSVKYVVVEDDDGNIKKEIAPDENGDKVIYETTQSLAPDSKALAGAMVALELIQTLVGKNNEFIGKDELDEQYAKFLDDKKRESVLMLARANDFDLQ